ncbi:MAG TPA: hypothetical protein DHV26_17780 [Cytophagales bacterium]|nr:hypothetical protein [Cytophagales bacterium]
MHHITFISTIHKEIGNCNAEELYKIIEKLSPGVIFLEAFDDSYSDYEKYFFSTYGEYHERLEIAAIQKYYRSNPLFKYVPVCKDRLSGDLHRKNNIVGQNGERQQWINNFKSLTEKHGFKFLNSSESVNLLEEIRVLENLALIGTEVGKIFEAAMKDYENSMPSEYIFIL